MRNRSPIGLGLLACALCCLLPDSAWPADVQPVSRAPIAVVINYSSAPWDGAAYEIVIPIGTATQGSGPKLRISIWGNPEFPRPHTYRVAGKDSMKEGAQALFWSGHEKSMPENLAGTITFTRLKKAGPVSGSVDLATPAGREFKERFVAKWGNDRMTRIR